MSLTLAMSEPANRPGTLLCSPAPEPFEAHAIVHVVGFDDETRGEISDLFLSVGTGDPRPRKPSCAGAGGFDRCARACILDPRALRR